MSLNNIKLTQYSHGQGCGCKIAPKILDEIISNSKNDFLDKNLLVGNRSRDDAAVYDIGNGDAIISTTDFFMPIVDDPFDFGRIAATNAISDIYAMGGKPIMAIAIFGWPIDKIPAKIANLVIEGGKSVCNNAKITLAGGHSIDTTEPIFGLAVTGKVKVKNLKENSKAKIGDKIYLTKALGIGILTTALKQGKISKQDEKIVIELMCRLNNIGVKLAKIIGVNAITDVTGFGLGGHLIEVCKGSKVCAKINFNKLPILPNVYKYLEQGCSPGGAMRNFESYGHDLNTIGEKTKAIICDPQTSGGLLVMVSKNTQSHFEDLMKKEGFNAQAIGEIVGLKQKTLVEINE